jgi:hypothetical protein
MVVLFTFMPYLQNSCAECYAGTAAAEAARHTRRGRVPFPHASPVACPIAGAPGAAKGSV